MCSVKTKEVEELGLAQQGTGRRKNKYCELDLPHSGNIFRDWDYLNWHWDSLKRRE